MSGFAFAVFKGVLIVVFSVLCALAGLRLVRRRVPAEILEKSHDVAGFIIAVVGTIYAVLLAFMVIVVWEQFEDARTIAAREANYLGDVDYMARGFPLEISRPIHLGLIAYGQAVVRQEWTRMTSKGADPGARGALFNVWRVCHRISPSNPRETVLYQTLISRLADLNDSRRLRLHAAQASLPGIMWILLIGGGIITISFTYFFAVRTTAIQSLMTVSLTTLIAFILFLIYAIDRPFVGCVTVCPDALEDVLARVEMHPVEYDPVGTPDELQKGTVQPAGASPAAITQVKESSIGTAH